jgi:hypothetical protein
MGCNSSKHNAKEPVRLVGTDANGPSDDVHHRLVRMPICPGLLDKVLDVVCSPETLLALKSITGIVDIEMIEVSDGLICTHTCFTSKASMEQAEPKIREVLKPVSEYFVGAPERSLAVGGTVTPAGKQVWTLSNYVDDVHHRLVRMSIRPGTLDHVLAFVNRHETLATLKSVAGLMHIEIIDVSDSLICAHTRYKNKESMEQAEPQIRQLLKPVTEHYMSAPERSLAVGGRVALTGTQVWALSKCSMTDAVMAAIPPQEPVAAAAMVPVPEEACGGDAEGDTSKIAWLCC